VTENLSAAAQRANLTPEQRKQIDGLGKLLSTHKNLLAMPAPMAQQKFSALPQEQQNAMVGLLGGDDAPIEENRGWLGNAKHYAGIAVRETLGRGVAALGEASDFMTRLYRTGAIALDQGVNIGKAFDIANDKGDTVFSPSRISNAKRKYGSDRVDIAMRVAQGETLDSILATGTEAQKQIAAAAAQNRDDLFQDALDAVQASKYSPGRQVANFLLPESMEGSGFLYKGISGVVDASYRIFSDPTLLLGKAKKAYDAGDFLLFNVLGKEKFTYGRQFMSVVGPQNTQNLDRVFSQRGVQNFFDQYGKNLDDYAVARAAKDPAAMEQASRNLRRMAPEFGPAAVDEFIKAGVKNAETAKSYLQNVVDVKTILSGQASRRTPLVPRLDTARKARINFFTATDKVFNIDNVGRRVVTALYGGAPQFEDVLTGITTRAEDIAQQEAFVGRFGVRRIEEVGGKAKWTKGKDGALRMPLAQIQGRLDRFARKFTTIPYFPNGFFDPMANDAVTQIYRLSRLTNTRYHSRIIAEAFTAGNEGQRRQIFKGLYNTIFEVRGLTKSTGSQRFVGAFNKVGRKDQYSAGITVRSVDEATGKETFTKYSPSNFDGEELALWDWQVAEGIAAPAVSDVDRFATRSGLIDRIMGVSHQNWANKTTSTWTLATLAGPRFPIRNASEDLGLSLLVGDSPWGVVKGQLIARKYAAAKGDMGFVNRIFARREANKYSSKIAKLIEEGDVEAARKVAAQAVTESKFANFLDDEVGEFISDLVTYGDPDRFLGNLAEGAKNAFRGADRYTQVANDIEDFGRVGVLQVDNIKYATDYGKPFTRFSPDADDTSLMSFWAMVGIQTKSPMASAAIKELREGGIENNQRAYNALVDYLRGLSSKELNRFEAIQKGYSVEAFARKQLEDILSTFTTRDGKFNSALLKKIRSVDKEGNVIVSAKGLSFEDDMKALADEGMLPEWTFGPTLVPISDTSQVLPSVSDKIWDIMGEANARLSRHPIGLDAYAKVRKDMRASGLEEHIISNFTKGLEGANRKVALDNAKKYLSDMAEEMATTRVLSYVDNPAVRSQLAMSSRNFARFYRATEDFYRRIYRAVKYNPESISRAALTYEGVAHSGFVQTDDNGEQYFFYPGLTPVYKVMNKVATVFGMPEAFKAPMPIEFGGKLKMITPSMNPDSLFPTFAGPLASVPLAFVFRAVPQLEKIEAALVGEYGQDQPIINAALPGHVNKLLALLNKDERSSQYASAFRKAATYLEANGYGVEIKTDPVTGEQIPPTPGELQEYKERLEASTLTVLGLRFLFGFAAPASPQLTLKSEMAQWVRDNKRTSYKQVFNQLLNQYNGDIDKTTQEWIRLFPDQMPYTVSESDRTTVALVRSVNNSGTWISENEALIKKYPQGAPFLIPSVGDFDFDSYRLMFNSGLKVNKTTSDFLREVQTARDIQYYYDQKDIYENQLANTFNDQAKSALRRQWQVWSDQYKGIRPIMSDELAAGGSRQIQRLRAYEDLRRMLADPDIKTQPNTRAVLTQMAQEFDAYQLARDSVSSNSETAQNYRDLMKQNIRVRLKEIASQNTNAMMAYDVLFARLIGE
jgi:hypothetical protein